MLYFASQVSRPHSRHFYRASIFVGTALEGRRMRSLGGGARAATRTRRGSAGSDALAPPCRCRGPGRQRCPCSRPHRRAGHPAVLGSSWIHFELDTLCPQARRQASPKLDSPFPDLDSLRAKLDLPHRFPPPPRRSSFYCGRHGGVLSGPSHQSRPPLPRGAWRNQAGSGLC